jgi:hypothetical protein
LLISLTVSTSTHADELVTNTNQILSSIPENTFRLAIASNDLRFFHTPLCAEGMPGLDFATYRGKRSNPKEIWSTCKELMGEEHYHLLLKMEKLVEEYNKSMAEHRK